MKAKIRVIRIQETTKNKLAARAYHLTMAQGHQTNIRIHIKNVKKL